MADQEPLLAASGVRLFGVEVKGLTINLANASVPGGLLQNRFNAAAGDPRLVRVYGFSFEGQYYDLARPTIYLLFGDGQPAGGQAIPKKVGDLGFATDPPELVAGLQYWLVDQSDFSLRLDIDVGPIERILVEMEIGPDQQRAPYAGQNVRSGYAGQNVRYAGQNARLRYAGQNARLQGGSSD
jgi:hypothetical protein